MRHQSPYKRDGVQLKGHSHFHELIAIRGILGEGELKVMREGYTLRN